MSASSIDAGFIRSYKTNVEVLLQQKGSKLRRAVTEDMYTGKAGMVVEQIRATEAVTKANRHTDTPLVGSEHTSRWVHPIFKEWADLVDDIDKVQRLTDPQSTYAQSGTYALGRAMDREIITATFGTAKTGVDGNTSVVFDNTNQRVDVDVGGVASGLNLQKLREAKRMLLRNEVDTEFDEIFCIITAQQHDDLLNQTQAISLDYQTRPVLEEGMITRFMGMNFIIYNSLLSGVQAGLGTEDRLIPVWAKSGMHLGMWNDIEAKIDQRPDKSYNWQVYLKAYFGATRLEEGKVVNIECNEP